MPLRKAAAGAPAGEAGLSRKPLTVPDSDLSAFAVRLLRRANLSLIPAHSLGNADGRLQNRNGSDEDVTGRRRSCTALTPSQ